jgi:hypothetical protein
MIFADQTRAAALAEDDDCMDFVDFITTTDLNPRVENVLEVDIAGCGSESVSEQRIFPGSLSLPQFLFLFVVCLLTLLYFDSIVLSTTHSSQKN